MMKHKKGFITSPGDLFKGLLIGIILGIVLAVLMAKGVLPGESIFCTVAP